MEKRIIIIPTYNEKENIEKIIRYVFSLPDAFDILVIDDGSPDGTAAIVKKLMPEFDTHLFLEERKGKLGLGTAYIHGFNWSIRNNYDYIFEMDADFSHNPQDLIRLYQACKEQDADLAVGSRYCNGVNVVNWPMSRILTSYYGSMYVRTVLRTPVRDNTAGFVCYSRKVLEAINFDRIKHIGYGFQIEMKFVAWKLGFKIVEVPIVFTDRQEGTSKMSKGIFKEAIFGVIKLRTSALFGGIKRYKK
ncbi:MAG: polyprenol monophosphomannose synthase [Bacteroidales bacterium]|jgi:dolichol-phosphate mannosyltransferase|nr:polyprenol monophosphomannose synthase [Bacteroidales bacterium]MDD2687718.1 polyprenol monophosphomannose synthase [Bacteroidales bacterium]MDD3331241.1 polyprenol monophosphomannose synthase [Bacteroidales bacterium]MDD3691226.1 polyprenol monophosphomannose synthase [Bacteroidales bacterium]MDD4045427.1 polyprenol monophosphomannose synthase [Bacteroidales bacterium]